MTYTEWLEDKLMQFDIEGICCDEMNEHPEEWEYCGMNCKNGEPECLRRLYKAMHKDEPQNHSGEVTEMVEPKTERSE